MFHDLNENIVDDNYFSICECGQLLDLATANNDFQRQEFSEGQLLTKKVCPHGITVFNSTNR